MSRKSGGMGPVVAAGGGPGSRHSISTEKIDNGFLVHTSSYNPDTDEYSEKTTFTSKEPRIVPGRVAYERDGNPSLGSSLAKAIAVLGGKEG